MPNVIQKGSALTEVTWDTSGGGEPPKAQPRIAIFVISLVDSHERRKIVSQYLSRVGLPWEFVDATRYKAGIAYSDVQIDLDVGLLPGEIGCFLSHRALWKKISKTDLDYAVVLEDDTVLIPALEFSALFTILGKLHISFIYLFVHNVHHAIPLVHLGASLGALTRVKRPRHGLGTGAYALNPQAAEKLYTSSRLVRTPVDIWIETVKNHQIYMCSHFPPVAVQIRSPSTVWERAAIAPKQGISAYAVRRLRQFFEDLIDERKLAKVDRELRLRADALVPGMATRRFSKAQAQLVKLLKRK
jgi:glycosyl transferase family 25